VANYLPHASASEPLSRTWVPHDAPDLTGVTKRKSVAVAEEKSSRTASSLGTPVYAGVIIKRTHVGGSTLKPGGEFEISYLVSRNPRFTTAISGNSDFNARTSVTNIGVYSHFLRHHRKPDRRQPVVNVRSPLLDRVPDRDQYDSMGAQPLIANPSPRSSTSKALCPLTWAGSTSAYPSAAQPSSRRRVVRASAGSWQKQLL
jgi:hypothetical protein